MIPEEQQDQAALYVLDLLDLDERAAFESAMKANAELADLVSELREAAAAVALSVPLRAPPAVLKQRILRQVALEKPAPTVTRTASRIPWAIAAAIAFLCGLLAIDRARLERELTELRTADPLSGTTVIALATTPAARADSKGSIAWEPDRQTGIIRVSNMPPPDPGKDYQLWVVDAEHPDPISAGLLLVNKQGVAEVHFRPVVPANRVKAFAISVEREGGVPKKEGPIVMVGNA